VHGSDNKIKKKQLSSSAYMFIGSVCVYMYA
jgi:hypothetical protein